MKEIMVPYVLLIYILVKTGVMPWNVKTQFWSTAIGCFILFMLWSGSRFWAPVDMTNSTTVRAPSVVLSRWLGQQIDEIYVDHNQMVKKGQLLYTLRDETTGSQTNSIKAQIESTRAAQDSTRAQIEATKAQLANNRKELKRHQELGELSTEQEVDKYSTAVKNNVASIKGYEAQLINQDAQIKKLEADLEAAEYNRGLTKIRAPMDGQISMVNVANGTVTGNMSMYDTSRKFVEMRIPEGSFNYIQPGMYAEFYLNTFPGHIFRAKVHSKRSGTGEASVRTRQGDESTRQFIAQNSGPQGRTIILSFEDPEGIEIPIGSTGAGFVSAWKPKAWLGFMDVIGGATIRIFSVKAYFSSN